MALSDFLSHYQPKKQPAYDADLTLYVAKNGDDAGKGTKDAPFATIERGLQEIAHVRAQNPEKSVTLRVSEGTYRTEGLSVTPEMSGTEDAPVAIVADGEVLLDGGVTLTSDAFEPVSGEIKDRLHDEAKENVFVADLKKYGITPEQYGPVYAVGRSTASCYDGDTVGQNCEVFCNGQRMTLAQWPNKGEYLHLDAVADVGDCHEFPPQNYYDDWGERRNHRGGIYIMSETDNNRVKTWKSYDNIWSFGYYMWDWADSSTPVTIDTAHRRFFPKYVSFYGARAGALYYFYNVLDELDVPGEWYLDRENGLLYVYPIGPMADAKISISLTRKPILTVDAHDVTLDGISIRGTRADGITLKGERDSLLRLNVTGVGGNAIVGAGADLAVRECDISHTGAGGIILTGGDRQTLTPGRCVVDNNYVHDFAEVYMTYAPGVSIAGVGNVCSHNEICRTPHIAVLYGGNDHLIEYNYIHDTVWHSSDSGAIYSGRSWTDFGDVVRYNVIDHTGNLPEFNPQGIYWDDGESGQTAYGNLILNVGNLGFEIGGGHEITVKNNILIDTDHAIEYDDRHYDGIHRAGWAKKDVDTPEGCMWVGLRSVPYNKGIWAERYPSLSLVKTDFADLDDPYFPVNPAHSDVTGNLMIASRSSDYQVSDPAFRYSKIENTSFASVDEVGFVDPANGNYNLRPDAKVFDELPDFEPIPLDRIGRY